MLATAAFSAQGIWPKELRKMAKSGKAAQWAARHARLSAALRQNLKKRRQQAKRRELARHGAAIEDTAAPEPALTAPVERI